MRASLAVRKLLQSQKPKASVTPTGKSPQYVFYIQRFLLILLQSHFGTINKCRLFQNSFAIDWKSSNIIGGQSLDLTKLLHSFSLLLLYVPIYKPIGAAAVAFFIRSKEFQVSSGGPFWMDHLFNIIALNLTIAISQESTYACCSAPRHH